MKKEIADKWVAELRSGKYIQGQYHLVHGDRYCCLGVLCEIAEKENACKVDTSETDVLLRFDGETETLPTSVMEWADIKKDDGLYGTDRVVENLITQNDNGVSFSEIADIIEKNWEKI